MPESTKFDLVDIAKTFQKRQRTILIIALIAGLAAAAAWLLGARKYKANASVLVANPLYSDRNNIFRNDKVMFVDYFGREDDIDKVMAVAKSDQTQSIIVNYMQLAKTYKLDTSKEADRVKLFSRFKKSFDVKRTEYQNMEISYVDPDPKLSADVVNNAVRLIDQIYTGYYDDLRLNAKRTIQGRMGYTDSMITTLTDSLAILRDKYKIYDIMSPSRQGLINGSISHAGGPGYGRAMEEVQNVEATKDQLVTDRARFVSLMNEFSAGNSVESQPQIQVISPAYVPDKAEGLGLILTIIISILVAAFFATMWFFLVAYYKALTQKS
ncbi:MAG: Wzz/FepE/Etk N-terminal domain-containing protein [Chitinophagaceae bacterium]